MQKWYVLARSVISGTLNSDALILRSPTSPKSGSQWIDPEKRLNVYECYSAHFAAEIHLSE
jgi:hypothetical protein